MNKQTDCSESKEISKADALYNIGVLTGYWNIGYIVYRIAKTKLTDGGLSSESADKTKEVSS